MAYREVRIFETKGIVRQWLPGVPTKHIAVARRSPGKELQVDTRASCSRRS